MGNKIANLEIDNSANLTIVTRNDTPKREGYYPHTWMISSVGQAVRVDVAHDSDSNPYVEDRRDWD